MACDDNPEVCPLKWLAEIKRKKASVEEPSRWPGGHSFSDAFITICILSSSLPNNFPFPENDVRFHNSFAPPPSFSLSFSLFSERLLQDIHHRVAILYLGQIFSPGFSEPSLRHSLLRKTGQLLLYIFPLLYILFGLFTGAIRLSIS